MKQHTQQLRAGHVPPKHRLTAMLCLLLLLCSMAHATVGHVALHSLHPGHGHVDLYANVPSTDAPDACTLCASMHSARPLQALVARAPSQSYRASAPARAPSRPLTGWHHSVSCRPPPAA